MPSVSVKENESLDFAIRRLKRIIEKNGLSKEVKRREFYEPPSKIRKKHISTIKKRLFKRLLREKNLLKRGNRH